MRIGIDIAKALGPPDGIGRYLRGLLGGLMEIDRENQYLLYPLSEPVPRGSFAARFPDVPPNFSFRRRRGPAAGEVDLFHAAAYALPRRHRGPLVLTLHDLTFLTHPRAHTLDNRLHCLAGTAVALARGARLIAVSESTRRDAVAELALDAGAIEVIPEAAEPSFRPLDRDEARRRVARRFGVEGPYVLSVATAEPRKNLGRLLVAWRDLPAELRRSHRLLLAGGRGWLGVDPEARALQLGLGEEVRHLGAVGDDDLVALYSAAAAFAYPSLYEGFGLPPLEAMACGAPVVTSNLSSLPEVVGEAAVLVDPEDPASIRDGLAAVLADPARRQELRRAGLARAATFSWAETARRTLAVYRRAAGR